MTAARAASAIAPELPLGEPTREELLNAWRSVKHRRGERFEQVMQDPLRRICIRNIAHARRQKAGSRA